MGRIVGEVRFARRLLLKAKNTSSTCPYRLIVFINSEKPRDTKLKNRISRFLRLIWLFSSSSFWSRSGSIQHSVFFEEAIDPTFGIDNLLRTSVKRVIPRPDIDAEFWLGRTNSHHNFTVAINFGVWVPSRMNISFCHNLRC
jgi:hypothetical protein